MTDWGLERQRRPRRYFGGKQKHLANRLWYVDESLPTVKVTREMSFKEFRDLLVLLYGDEIISDEEFLLLYDSFISKNPDFPHENYQRFDLDSMNSAECKAEFGVEKHDLPRLVAAL